MDSPSAQRLEMIAKLIRERGAYAMGPADARAIDVVLAQLDSRKPTPPADDELVLLIRTLAEAGWRLSRT